MVVDGSGDGISTSIFRGTSAGLELLRTFPFTQSLGWFYETVAEHLGLGDWSSSGKMMGLAAYGRPTYEIDFLRAVEGGYFLNLSAYGVSPSDRVETEYLDLAYYWRLKRAYAEALATLGVPAHVRPSRFDPDLGKRSQEVGFTQKQADLAASAQQLLEGCLLQLARAALAEAGSSKLCIAGGVGLNCSANGTIWRASGAAELFVQPAAGDSGCAIGAALETARRLGDLGIPPPRMTSTSLGPAFSDAAIRALLVRCGLKYSCHDIEDLTAKVARILSDGLVVGWFQGGAEAGPRALGQRSILADPRQSAMRDRVNAIKHREGWRPLAPTIHASGAAGLVQNLGPAEFMIVAYPATERAQRVLPASVHVDGSLRPQVVAGDDPYARLVAAFGERSGIPALLNTSFNHESEPIVCTPLDAIRTFWSTEMDARAIGSFLIIKEGRCSP